MYIYLGANSTLKTDELILNVLKKRCLSFFEIKNTSVFDKLIELMK